MRLWKGRIEYGSNWIVQRVCIRGVFGDFRVIFLTAESASSAARFRVVLSELRYGLVENCSEWNSHFRAVGRTHGMRPSGRRGGVMQGIFWGAGLLGFIRVRGYRFEVWRNVGHLPFLKWPTFYSDC